jgi:hypothetical protein
VEVGYCDAAAPLLACPMGAWASSFHAPAREPIASLITLLFSLPRVVIVLVNPVAVFSRLHVQPEHFRYTSFVGLAEYRGALANSKVEPHD